jgi:ABC-type multidrug transport system ATPase subunit
MFCLSVCPSVRQLTCSAHATGMMEPTSGDALINGLSIRDHMDAIRRSLGVCPQFDILWPDITVREHLHLYAAIKGYARSQASAAAEATAREVGA